MDASKLRAWLWRRQGLDGSLSGKPAAEALQRAGWARCVGGAAPYLTLFARTGQSREATDAAVARLEIHELPSARGCTYVLPARDFALGLKLAQGFDSESKVAEKLGVTAREMDKLCGAIIKALEKGPLDPEELRGSVGGAVRNLGAEGQKKGLTTTMPVALGKLQTSGEIRRVPVNGRLDQQRYRYALWRPNPLRDFKLSTEEAYVSLARLFYAWIGLASLAEFQWFSALGAKAAKAAVAPLQLEPIAPGDERLMTPEDRADLETFKAPADAQYALVGGLDSIVLLRRNHRDLLDPKDLEREAFVDKGTKPLGGLADLPNHAILDRGRIIGLWEYDTATESIVWMSFVKKSKPLDEAVARTEEYVRTQLGDARSYSLDSPRSRAARIKALSCQRSAVS